MMGNASNGISQLSKIAIGSQNMIVKISRTLYMLGVFWYMWV